MLLDELFFEVVPGLLLCSEEGGGVDEAVLGECDVFCFGGADCDTLGDFVDGEFVAGM